MNNLDFLNSIGDSAEVKEEMGKKGKKGKKYKSEKLIKSMNVEIEKYFDDNIKGYSYTTYSQFIKTAIYEHAKKHGFKH